jgi:transcriptional regulator with XRE-family HTH domain
MVVETGDRTVGARVRARREARGGSLTTLAQRSGAYRGTIWLVEVGRVQPGLLTLRRLAAALDCTVGDLLGETEADS